MRGAGFGTWQPRTSSSTAAPSQHTNPPPGLFSSADACLLGILFHAFIEHSRRIPCHRSPGERSARAKTFPLWSVQRLPLASRSERSKVQKTRLRAVGSLRTSSRGENKHVVSHATLMVVSPPEGNHKRGGNGSTATTETLGQVLVPLMERGPRPIRSRAAFTAPVLETFAIPAKKEHRFALSSPNC